CGSPNSDTDWSGGSDKSPKLPIIRNPGFREIEAGCTQRLPLVCRLHCRDVTDRRRRHRVRPQGSLPPTHVVPGTELVADSAIDADRREADAFVQSDTRRIRKDLPANAVTYPCNDRTARSDWYSERPTPCPRNR